MTIQDFGDVTEHFSGRRKHKLDRKPPKRVAGLFRGRGLSIPRDWFEYDGGLACTCTRHVRLHAYAVPASFNEREKKKKKTNTEGKYSTDPAPIVPRWKRLVFQNFPFSAAECRSIRPFLSLAKRALRSTRGCIVDVSIFVNSGHSRRDAFPDGVLTPAVRQPRQWSRFESILIHARAADLPADGKFRRSASRGALSENRQANLWRRRSSGGMIIQRRAQVFPSPSGGAAVLTVITAGNYVDILMRPVQYSPLALRK